MTSAIKYTVRLVKLHCFRQHESDGDEIFIKYKNRKVWPVNAKYQRITVGGKPLEHDITAIKKDTMLTIELWDWDLMTGNDKLGVFSFLVNEKGGAFTTDLKKEYRGNIADHAENAKYALEWEVI